MLFLRTIKKNKELETKNKEQKCMPVIRLCVE